MSAIQNTVKITNFSQLATVINLDPRFISPEEWRFTQSDLDVNEEYREHFISQLSQDTSITSIRMQRFTEQILNYIAQALKKNSTAVALKLSSGNWSYWTEIPEFLKVNTTLRVLHLMGCRAFYYPCVREAQTARRLGDALKVNRTLQILNLRDNNMSSRETEAVLNGLIENRGVQELALGNSSGSHTTLDQDCSNTLTKVLNKNRVLSKIKLDYERICGLSSIFLNLQNSIKLTILDLGIMPLDVSELASLERFSSVNSTLGEICFGVDSPDNQTPTALARVLMVASIKNITLYIKTFCPSYVDALAISLSRNFFINRFSLRTRNVQEYQNPLVRALENNCFLQEFHIHDYLWVYHIDFSLRLDNRENCFVDNDSLDGIQKNETIIFNGLSRTRYSQFSQTIGALSVKSLTFANMPFLKASSKNEGSSLKRTCC